MPGLPSPTPAIFGITNDALNLVVNLLILFLVVLWLSLVAWTFLDARRRMEDGVLVACSAACSLIFPFVGAIVYSILRPPEFLEDKHERELEIRAAELRVRQLEEASCPNCEHPIERTYLRCPHCRARIKDPCESCGKPIDPRWSICPYCETPVRRAAPPERRPATRRAARPPVREAAPASSRTASASASRSARPVPKPKPAAAPAPDSGQQRTDEQRTTKQRKTTRTPTRSGTGSSRTRSS
jgi:Double zinc ribbon